MITQHREIGTGRFNLLARILLSATVACCFRPPAIADDLAWHEDQFVEMLSQRNLNSLARLHATRKRDQETDPNQKALWQLRIAELIRNQIWFVESTSRSEILEQGLKDSLKTDGVTAPMLRFKLQMEAAKTVLAESTVTLLSVEASHLYSGGPYVKNDVSTKRRDQLSQEIDRLNKALQEVSGRDSIFQSDQKREVRDILRRMMASLKCQRFHWLAIGQPGVGDQQLNALNAALEDTLRSCRSVDTKVQLQLLLTDLASRYSDSADYRFRKMKLLSTEPNLSPMRLAEIQIRHFLRQEQVEEAAEELINRSALTELDQQKQLWLAAEVAIGKAEQAKRLNDELLISSAADQIQAIESAASRLERGALGEAIRACLRTANRIIELGPDLAQTFKRIEFQRQSGNTEQALQMAIVALKQLPAGRMEASRAALILMATELQIRLKHWAESIEYAEAATESFQQLRMNHRAAAADLMKCFALSQMIAENPSSRAEYLAALRSHCSTYTDSKTNATATTWLLKLTSQSESDIAINTALARLKYPIDDAEYIRLSATLNHEFWHVLTSEDFRFDSKLNNWEADFQESRSSVQSEDTNNLYIEIAVDLVLRRSRTRQLSEWRKQLTSHEKRQPGLELNLHHLLLTLVIDARLSTVGPTLSALQDRLLDRPGNDLEDAFWFLARVTRQTDDQNQIHSGDVFLARTVDRIAASILQKSRSPAAFALKCLPIVTNTAAMTGDQFAIKKVMAEISPDKLTHDSLIQVAPTLGLLSDQANMTPRLRSTLMEFWQGLIKNQPAGSELWLESLLQIGTLTTDTQRKKSLLRQFQTANVLYPEWGSPERRAAALSIIEKLRE